MPRPTSYVEASSNMPTRYVEASAVPTWVGNQPRCPPPATTFILSFNVIVISDKLGPGLLGQTILQKAEQNTRAKTRHVELCWRKLWDIHQIQMQKPYRSIIVEPSRAIIVERSRTDAMIEQSSYASYCEHYRFRGMDDNSTQGAFQIVSRTMCTSCLERCAESLPSDSYKKDPARSQLLNNSKYSALRVVH